MSTKITARSAAAGASIAARRRAPRSGAAAASIAATRRTPNGEHPGGAARIIAERNGSSARTQESSVDLGSSNSLDPEVVRFQNLARGGGAAAGGIAERRRQSSSTTESAGPAGDPVNRPNEHTNSTTETAGPAGDPVNRPDSGEADEPFVLPPGDEDNPYPDHNATSVTVTPWDGHGEEGSPNDSISSILLDQGYTQEELFAEDDNGDSLIQQVANANDIDDPNIIHPGDELVVPTRTEATETPAAPDTQAPQETEPSNEEDYDPTTDPNHPAGPNGPGGNSLAIPPNYDPTTDPDHPAGPNGPGGNSLAIPPNYDPTTDPNHPAGPNGPGGNSLAVPQPEVDPTTDPNHPAGPNGPGGNSLAVPQPEVDPTTDPNHPAGPNGPGGNSLSVPQPQSETSSSSIPSYDDYYQARYVDRTFDGSYGTYIWKKPAGLA